MYQRPTLVAFGQFVASADTPFSKMLVLGMSPSGYKGTVSEVSDFVRFAPLPPKQLLIQGAKNGDL